jgi:hypothetical protein
VLDICWYVSVLWGLEVSHALCAQRSGTFFCDYDHRKTCHTLVLWNCQLKKWPCVWVQRLQKTGRMAVFGGGDFAMCSLKPRAWNHSYRDYTPVLWEPVLPFLSHRMPWPRTEHLSG